MDNEEIMEETEIIEDDYEDYGPSKGLIVAGVAAVAAIGAGAVAAVRHFLKKDKDDVVIEEDDSIMVTEDTIPVEITE